MPVIQGCCSCHTLSTCLLCYRLELCKRELLKQVEKDGHTIPLCSQLGAVCGSQGDCQRQMEQPQQAKLCYEESVQHLKACQTKDAEVRICHLPVTEC